VLGQYIALLRNNRNYRLLWCAQVVSELGDWFYTLAVYHLLLDLTGSKAQAVGLAVVLQVLPSTLAAPTAGVVNDRISRKAIMIGADIARFFVVLGMLVVRTPSMVWLVYPLLFVETIGAAFFEPAHSSVIPNIVPGEDVLAANTLSSITWSFCLAAGASLGGLVAVLFGRDAVFILNAISFLASAWLIRRMAFAEPHAAGQLPLRARELVEFTPVLEGLRYIRSEPRLFATVFVKGGIGLLGANNVLLPILGERVFPVKMAGLDHARGAMLGMSMLMGARGAGALMGPLVSGRWARDHQSRLRTGIFFGFLLAAAGYVCLGTSTSLAVAILAVIAAHAGSSTNWVFSSTLLQIYTEDRFRGRVFSADYGLCMLGISASSYFCGVAIDLGVPARTFAVAIGCVMVIPAAAWAIALKVTSPGNVSSRRG
jgi:MFS family permease